MDNNDFTVYFDVTEADVPAGFELNSDGSYSFDPTDPAYDYLNVGDEKVLTVPVTATFYGADTVRAVTTDVQITIRGTDDAPVTSIDTHVVDEGASLIGGQLITSDVDNDTTANRFTVADGAEIPIGFVLHEDGFYSFDPANAAYEHLKVGATEEFIIPVAVRDDAGITDTTEITITLNGTNDAPVASAEVTKAVEEGGAAITGQLTSTDLDDDATAVFSVSDGQDTPAGFVLNADGSYSFDPTDTAYDHISEGAIDIVTVPVTVTDEHGATDTTQIRITITGTNDEPVAGAEVVATVDEGSDIITGQLDYTDPDDDAVITFAISEDAVVPAGFVLNDDGSYSFDPKDEAYEHLNVGDQDTYIIPVTLTDNTGASDTTQITITVIGTNDGPVAAGSGAAVFAGAAVIAGAVTSTDLDDDATAAYTISQGFEAPAGFALNENGSYSFDPGNSAYEFIEVGQKVQIGVPVTVTDDNGDVDTAMVTLTVEGTYVPPVDGDGSSILTTQRTIQLTTVLIPMVAVAAIVVEAVVVVVEGDGGSGGGGDGR